MYRVWPLAGTLTLGLADEIMIAALGAAGQTRAEVVLAVMTGMLVFVGFGFAAHPNPPHARPRLAPACLILAGAVAAAVGVTWWQEADRWPPLAGNLACGVGALLAAAAISHLHMCLRLWRDWRDAVARRPNLERLLTPNDTRHGEDGR